MSRLLSFARKNGRRLPRVPASSRWVWVLGSANIENDARIAESLPSDGQAGSYAGPEVGLWEVWFRRNAHSAQTSPNAVYGQLPNSGLHGSWARLRSNEA
jgi:hypothetical protein